MRLATEPGNTAAKIERDLGTGRGVISHWKRQLRQNGDEAFPGKGHLKPQDEELRRLRRENERLCRERDILKKAVAIFSPVCRQAGKTRTGIRVHSRAPGALERSGDVPGIVGVSQWFLQLAEAGRKQEADSKQAP